MSCIHTLNLFQLLLLRMHVLFMLLLGKYGQETQNINHEHRHGQVYFLNKALVRQGTPLMHCCATWRFT